MRTEDAIAIAGVWLLAFGLIGCPSNKDCSHDVDCPGTQVCKDGVCLFPSCEGACDPGEYCEGARCLPCDDDQHCGQACEDCTAGQENRACVDGACGCEGQADCLEQQLCYQAVCTWCVPECATRCCGNDGCFGECPDRCGELGQVCDPISCRCEDPCEPVTCEDLGAACGAPDDGCGRALDCGACPDGDVCSAAGQCVGPPRPHDGAGDGCTCEGADCSVPCPEGEGAASICLVTNEPNPNDGFCSFNCSGPGRDADCQLDFVDGCCLAFGPVYYCVDQAHCPGERQYLQTCGQVEGWCDTDLVCVVLADGEPAHCLWACDVPDGACADGGECVGLEGGGGACLPPGDLPVGALCYEPVWMCAPGLRCLRSRPGYMGFCSAECSCQSLEGCADPDGCFWELSIGVATYCHCGIPCPSGDPTTDCSNAYEWECQDISATGAPFFACVPALASP